MTFDEYSQYLNDTLAKINEQEIKVVTNLIYESYLNGNMVFIIGNGGSGANASHFAEDLAKGTCTGLDQKKRVKALSLTDNLPWITAISNDHGYENVFEQQLRTFAKEEDLLIAISGSGNSKNIIRAVEWGNRNGLVTVGISGYNGGRLNQINKHSVHVPLNDMCTSESIHSIIFHYVVLELQSLIFSSSNT